jgi:hypothetical protein
MKKPMRYNAGNAAQVFLAMHGSAIKDNDEAGRLILQSLTRLLLDAYDCGKRDGTPNPDDAPADQQ